MASRKEQKEALRREREARAAEAEAAARRKRLVGIGAGGLLALAAVVVAAVLLIGGGDGKTAAGGGDVLPGGGKVPEQRITDLPAAAKAAGCELKTVKVRSRNHVEGSVRYPTNPPAGGNHNPVPANDGAYSDPPPTEGLVHGLEHGRVIFWYKPNLPEKTRATLKALYDQDSYQLFLTPAPPGMPYDIAATAWNRDPQPTGTGRLLGCPRATAGTYDALRTFRDEHRGKGPEPIP